MNVKLVFLAGSWKLDALSFLEAHAFVFFPFQTRFPLQSVIASKAKQSQVFFLTITGFPLQSGLVTLRNKK